MHPELGETLNIDGRPLVRLDNAKDVLGKKDKRIAELEGERDHMSVAVDEIRADAALRMRIKDERIAELEGERDALERSIGALVRDGRAFYGACECSEEDELDERERFGAVLANYPEPDVVRWIEADEQYQETRKAELRARYARVVAKSAVIEAAKSLLEWEDSGEPHGYRSHIQSLRRAIGAYDSAVAETPPEEEKLDG